MKKALILLLFTFISSFSFAESVKDSLQIIELKNEIHILKNQVETLENSTDRILNSLYVTIGFILASVLGLNIWNLIFYNRKQNSLIKNKIEEAKKDLNKSITEQALKIPEKINDSQKILLLNF